MTVDTDSILVEQCLRGDRKSFESIVEKYQKTMFNAALRIVNDYDDAQDVTQSSFVKAFENLSSYDPKYKFFSWLYRIGVNESLNFLNQKKDFEGLDDGLISRDKGPEEAYHDLEQREDVREALMCLKIDYRTVVVLKHFQNLSYKEISYILDLPEKTVKARLFTARQLLREVLLKKGF